MIPSVLFVAGFCTIIVGVKVGIREAAGTGRDVGLIMCVLGCLIVAAGLILGLLGVAAWLF